MILETTALNIPITPAAVTVGSPHWTKTHRHLHKALWVMSLCLACKNKNSQAWYNHLFVETCNHKLTLKPELMSANAFKCLTIDLH